MTRFAVAFALTLLVVDGGCLSTVSLGQPSSEGSADGGAEVDADASQPARCSATSSRSVIATAAPSWGQFRAIAVSGTTLYALFAKTGTQAGTLGRVDLAGGTLVGSSVGTDPVALAVSGADAFVATRQEIIRADGVTTVTVTSAASPSSIVADDAGGAFWGLPGTDRVMKWSFSGGSPDTVAWMPRPTALALRGHTLYAVANGSLLELVPGDVAPAKIDAQCDFGAPVITNGALFCARTDGLSRVDLASRTTVLMAAGVKSAGAPVLAAGRVFWPALRGQNVVVTSVDVGGGPVTDVETVAQPTFLASDGCDMYFVSGRAILRSAR
jgi:hypothetical protein